jgi:hypothetical protein
VRPASIEDNPNDESSSTDIPRVYLKALSMIEFDPFLVAHGTATKVDVQVSSWVRIPPTCKVLHRFYIGFTLVLHRFYIGFT